MLENGLRGFQPSVAKRRFDLRRASDFKSFAKTKFEADTEGMRIICALGGIVYFYTLGWASKTQMENWFAKNVAVIDNFWVVYW